MDHADLDDLVELAELFDDGVIDLAFDVNEVVADLAVALVGEAGDVDAFGTEHLRDFGNHVRDVLVDDHDAALDAGVRVIDEGREVHRVADAAEFDVVLQFFNSHHSAVFFGFFGRSAEVREAGHLVVLDEVGIREVAEVALEGTGSEHLVDRGHLDDAATGEVHDVAALEAGEVLAVEQVLGHALDEGNVDGEEVGLGDDFVQSRGFNLVRKFVHVGGVRIRFVSEHAHVLPTGIVGDEHADLAEADDTERLAGEFHTGKLLLAAFDGLGEVRIVRVEALDPSGGLVHVTHGHAEHGHHEFGNGVGVGTRSVEHADALRGGLVDGDVVHASTGAGDGEKAVKVIRIDLSGTHQDGIRIFDGVGNLVERAKQAQAFLGNVVHRLNSCHDISPLFKLKHLDLRIRGFHNHSIKSTFIYYSSSQSIFISKR